MSPEQLNYMNAVVAGESDHYIIHYTIHSTTYYTLPLTYDTRAHKAEPFTRDSEDGAALQRGDESVDVDHVRGAAVLVLGAHHLNIVIE